MKSGGHSDHRGCGISAGDSDSDVVAEQLRTLAETARRWRLAGEHHRGHDSPQPLIGKCADNAYVMVNLLLDEGYDAVMIEGTTDKIADQLIQNGEDPATFATTEQLGGHIHYWVIVSLSDSAVWSVDIASDTYDRQGEIVVEPTQSPDGYFVQDDSVQQGERVQQNMEGRRCRYCGDIRLEAGGCPQCYSSDS